MRFRNSRLRTKITALLVSLVALWAFAAWVTLREGLNLLWASTMDEKIARPSVALVTALQGERRLSMVYLGSRGALQRKELEEQRARTNAAQQRLRQLAAGSDVSLAAGPDLEARIKQTFKQLDQLNPSRDAINGVRVDRDNAAQTFNTIIDGAFRIFGAAEATLDDRAIAKDSRTLNQLIRAKEVLSREDAMLAGVLAAGRFTGDDHAHFVQLVGSQRFLHAEAAAELPRADRVRYDQLVSGATFTRFRILEDRVIRKGKPGARLPVAALEWQSTVEPSLDGLEKLVLTGGDDLLQRSKPVGVGVLVRLILAGGLGLIAVIASIVVSLTTARALVQQLGKLRAAAWELAEERLPGVVERLGRGEKVDIASEAPPLEFGSDEIGQVGQVFNVVQETAIRVAVEQAELRRSIRDILLSLARRTQVLVHQQLSLLDTMERRETTTEELEDLFRVDHLATRMRRNAENLIVLSGATPARGWRRSMPMVDVIRGAVAEVEDYTRVNVPPTGTVALVGRAVGDVTHLLAELIENAVSFSPPYTTVQVGGHMVANGYAIEVEDRGLGMSEEKLATANAKIVSPQEINLSSDTRLGLYVVSRLADRYGIRVSLKRSSYGGTTAVVLIPPELINEEGDGKSGKAPAAPEAKKGNGVDPAVALRSATTPPAQNGRHSRQHGHVELVSVTTEETNVVEPPASTSVSELGFDGDFDGDFDDDGVDEVSDLTYSQSTLPSGSVLSDDRGVSESPQSRAQESVTTPSGLPFRVPQSSLAPPLREAQPPAERSTPREQEATRSPEEIRRIVGSYQRGTERGRSDATSTHRQSADPPPSPDDEPQG